ncbi:hypothetical protein ACXVUM_10810 [Williamsia sp. SKLECPSW1]
MRTISTAAAPRGAGHRRSRQVVLSVVAVLALCGLVGACGSGSDKPATSTGPSALSLPNDFPRSDVPVLDGTLLSAGGTADEGWNLTVQGPANATTGLDDAVGDLTRAGYTVQQRTTDGGNKVVVLTATKSGTRYTVEVGSVAGSAGGGNSVFYQVSRG